MVNLISLVAALAISVVPMPQSVKLSEKPSEAKKVVTHISHKMAPEAYEMRIRSKKVVVRAGSEAGVFYALQTLDQLKESGELRQGVIKDSPRFAWRGYMLDESRHFFGMDHVKTILDMMARYKLNKFHWHLTDEPGWRIEIKKYPELTGIGAKGNYTDPEAPATWYTQDQIREIVAYAAERHIEVIPEIDMPGHATAANKAYPEFCGGGNEAHPDFTFNPGYDGTYAYLTDILREIADLFPSKYIHLGCDEVNFVINEWKKDAHIQELMKREKLQTVEDAEWYFLRRMADSLKVLDRELIAWDDAIFAAPDKATSTFSWWRHDKEDRLHDMLAQGYKVILCPRVPLYLDFIQDGSHKVGRIWGGKYSTNELAYAFPEALGLTAEELDLVSGMQANLWTEKVISTDRAFYLTFPRLTAMAEAAWTLPENKSWESFLARMDKEFKLMDSLGIYYYDLRNPSAHPEPAE